MRSHVCLGPLLAMGIAVAAAGCGHQTIGKPVVWPSPPDTARIRFVQAFRHTDDLDTSGWSRFKRSLVVSGSSPALRQPMGLAISEDGRRVYIADRGLKSVLVADFDKRTLDAFAPEEPIGQPFNVALDAEENVYVSDSAAHSVVVFNRKGEKQRVIGERDLERPTGLAVDRERRRLYVADSSRRRSDKHRVRCYDLAGKHLYDLGPRDGAASKGEGDGQFHFPTYLAVGRDGNVFVADTMNFRIQEFGPDGKFLRKFGEQGDAPGTFQRIQGLAFDGFGNLYVVDAEYSNVQIFNRAFQVLLFFGGFARKLEYFDLPSGIAIDPRTNRIYVCNEFVSRINVYELINTKPDDSTPKTTLTAR